jgi:hypothetical protein
MARGRSGRGCNEHMKKGEMLIHPIERRVGENSMNTPVPYYCLVHAA